MTSHSERSKAESKNPVEVRFKVAPRDPSPSLRSARDDRVWIGAIAILAQETFHDIAPPVDYSLIPPWVIFLGSVLVLALLGLLVWYGRKFFGKKAAVLTTRQRTLAELSEMEKQVERMPPYQFSIRVSDVLRRYVLEQFDLPITRQTSIEFLNSISAAKNFSEEEKSLLADFLNRCDLIKFARYEATAEDSRLLLSEARRFVEGGTLVAA